MQDAQDSAHRLAQIAQESSGEAFRLRMGWLHAFSAVSSFSNSFLAALNQLRPEDIQTLHAVVEMTAVDTRALLRRLESLTSLTGAGASHATQQPAQAEADASAPVAPDGKAPVEMPRAAHASAEAQRVVESAPSHLALVRDDAKAMG